MKTMFDVVFSSNPTLGVLNKSLDGSSFSVQMTDGDNGLNIPQNPKIVMLSVIGAEIWYNTRNVDNSNNQITYTPNGGSPTTYTIPNVLYTNDVIGDVINRVVGLGSGKFTITADENIGKMIITFDDATSGSIDFTQPNSIGVVLGFNNVGDSATNLYNVAPNESKFNAINYYIIQSDIVNQGMKVGTKTNGSIIAKINIDCKPNRQLLYSPNNPSLIGAQNLAGDKRTEYKFTLLNDNLNPVDTLGEYYSLHLRISYNIPIDYQLL